MVSRIARCVRGRWARFCEDSAPYWVLLTARLFLAFRRPQRQHGLPGELIVSLTTYPARFDILTATLTCLLSQSVKADRTILWVAKQDEKLLPERVRALTRRGLEIRVADDIGSFKKIIPALHQFPDAFIVTADDDLVYGRDWLDQLVTAWDRRHDVVVCHRARRISADDLGELRPYAEWILDVGGGAEAADLLPTTGAGALYPPGLLTRDALDVEAFVSLCPQADDLWLYWMGRRTGARFRNIGRPPEPWPGSQEIGLYKANLSGGNDEQIRRLVERYGRPCLS